MSSSSDESTPLLQQHQPLTLPLLQPFITHLKSSLLHHQSASTSEIIQDYVNHQSLPSDLNIRAYTIALCCYSLTLSHKDNVTALPVLDILSILSEQWHLLIANHPNQDIDIVLWSAFPVADLSPSSTKLLVIEALINPDVPRAISMHPIIVQSILSTWKLGNVLSRNPQSVWYDRLDSLATPRILHATELIYFIGHISLLVYYVLNPPIAEIQSNPPLDWRAFVLAISALAFILRRSWRSLAGIPFIFTIIAFFLALPASPQPNGFPYMFMLLSLSLHFLQIHFPYGPSLVFLYPQSRNLLLSCMLETIINDIFLPIVLFLFPIFIVVFALLSYSLAEPFLVPFGLLGVVIEITPVEARYALFFQLIAILVIFICLSTAMVILLPHIRYIRNDEIVAWDGFTAELALQTRQAMLTCIKEYLRPFFVPSPFTLLELLFVTFPTLALRCFRKGELAAVVYNAFLPALWRCSVLPFAYLVGTFWLWNLRTK